MPADEPDQTAGAVRGGRAPGRHRTDGADTGARLPPESHSGYDDWYGGGGWEADPQQPEPRTVAGPPAQRVDGPDGAQHGAQHDPHRTDAFHATPPGGALSPDSYWESEAYAATYAAAGAYASDAHATSAAGDTDQHRAVPYPGDPAAAAAYWSDGRGLDADGYASDRRSATTGPDRGPLPGDDPLAPAAQDPPPGSGSHGEDRGTRADPEPGAGGTHGGGADAPSAARGSTAGPGPRGTSGPGRDAGDIGDVFGPRTSATGPEPHGADAAGRRPAGYGTATNGATNSATNSGATNGGAPDRGAPGPAGGLDDPFAPQTSAHRRDPDGGARTRTETGQDTTFRGADPADRQPTARPSDPGADDPFAPRTADPGTDPHGAADRRGGTTHGDAGPSAPQTSAHRREPHGGTTAARDVDPADRPTGAPDAGPHGAAGGRRPSDPGGEAPFAPRPADPGTEPFAAAGRGPDRQPTAGGRGAPGPAGIFDDPFAPEPSSGEARTRTGPGPAAAARGADRQPTGPGAAGGRRPPGPAGIFDDPFAPASSSGEDRHGTEPDRTTAGRDSDPAPDAQAYESRGATGGRRAPGPGDDPFAPHTPPRGADPADRQPSGPADQAPGRRTPVAGGSGRSAIAAAYANPFGGPADGSTSAGDPFAPLDRDTHRDTHRDPSRRPAPDRGDAPFTDGYGEADRRPTRRGPGAYRRDPQNRDPYEPGGRGPYGDDPHGDPPDGDRSAARRSGGHGAASRGTDIFDADARGTTTYGDPDRAHRAGSRRATAPGPDERDAERTAVHRSGGHAIADDGPDPNGQAPARRPARPELDGHDGRDPDDRSPARRSGGRRAVRPDHDSDTEHDAERTAVHRPGGHGPPDDGRDPDDRSPARRSGGRRAIRPDPDHAGHADYEAERTAVHRSGGHGAAGDEPDPYAGRRRRTADPGDDQDEHAGRGGRGGDPRARRSGRPDAAADRGRGPSRGRAPAEDPDLDAAPPGFPARRPGDPQGAPAELFVETTAETPALRIDGTQPPDPARRYAGGGRQRPAPDPDDRYDDEPEYDGEYDDPTFDDPTFDDPAVDDGELDDAEYESAVPERRDPAPAPRRRPRRPRAAPEDTPDTSAPGTPAPEAAPQREKAQQEKAQRRVLGLALPGWLPGGTRAADAPPPGVGHGHGHGPARPAGRKVRILLAALLVPCALATLVGVVLLWPTGGPPETAGPISQEQVRAQVTATRATDCSTGSGDGGCVALVVHMADGPRPDRDLVQVVPVEPGSPRFAVGDQVVLGWSGANPDDAGSYQVVDFQRGAPLAWLAGLFAAAVLLLGRWRGLAALAALVLSFVVLLFFVVPAILGGGDPLAVAVVGACLIMFAVLYLTHGPSARTSTAVLGTLLSLALIGVLGAVFAAAAQLTGLDDQTSNLIASLGSGVDARGLLLAGVVIGALGVLDDVTVTQTSAVWELRQANPQLGARALFTAAMRIGRDHVASAVNTLVLAYAGAALPLLLLFSLSGRGFGDVVTAQDVATEVVRTLVGSIGLVASVPITTALAAAVAARETPEEKAAEPTPA